METSINLQPPPLPGSGEGWAIFLDIDGTLVGFDEDPALVALDASVLNLIRRVRDRNEGALGILSGRSLAQVDALLHPLCLPSGALHGQELRDPSRVLSQQRPPPAVAAEVEAQVRRALRDLEGVSLESKSGVNFALHFRAAPHQASAAARIAESIAGASHGQYEVQGGDCVVELKPVGSSKGMAMQFLMGHLPFRGRRPVVVGDDLTDEEAFAAASRIGGFGVVVGARTPTSARYRLPDPSAVHAWLALLIEGKPT
jgi:trehalose 6-phosphate phosphatase